MSDPNDTLEQIWHYGPMPRVRFEFHLNFNGELVEGPDPEPGPDIQVKVELLGVMNSDGYHPVCEKHTRADCPDCA